MPGRCALVKELNNRIVVLSNSCSDRGPGRSKIAIRVAYYLVTKTAYSSGKLNIAQRHSQFVSHCNLLCVPHKDELRLVRFLRLLKETFLRWRRSCLIENLRKWLVNQKPYAPHTIQCLRLSTSLSFYRNFHESIDILASVNEQKKLIQNINRFPGHLSIIMMD